MHKVITKGHEQIAEITRDASTNLFTASLTGQKEGTIVIEYENSIRTEYIHISGLK